MKAIALTMALALPGLMLFPARLVADAPPGEGPTSSSPSREELNAQISARRDSQVQANANRPSETAVANPAPNAPSLEGRIVFLEDGHRSVLLPARAILFTPGQTGYLKLVPRSKLKAVEWSEFLSANRAKIFPLVLQHDEVMRLEPLDTKVVGPILQMNALVVTIFNGKPIGLPDSKTSNIRSLLNPKP